MDDPIRLECYNNIRDCFKTRVTKYYIDKPDLLGDERSHDAILWSLEGLKCILNVLDGYNLVIRPEEPE